MKYWQKRKQERLYKQWREHAELPTESIPVKSITPEPTTPVSISTPEIPADAVTGIDVKSWAAKESWFYRFRVMIWEAVGKILRVK